VTGEGLLFLTTIHSMLLFTHARKYFSVRVFEKGVLWRKTGSGWEEVIIGDWGQLHNTSSYPVRFTKCVDDQIK
jgi:hypothetical protein